MALIKLFPLPGGYTAEYIKIDDYSHAKPPKKRTEVIFSIWKDKAARLAFLAGDVTKGPVEQKIRALIQDDPALFDAVFPDGEFSETAIYNAVKTGTVLCHTWFGSDVGGVNPTPVAQRILYGAIDDN